MSRASRMKKMADDLSMYPLMKTGDVAAYLNCDTDHVRKLAKAGHLPYTDIGLGERTEYRFDPMDIIVYRLAQFEGQTPEEYWEEHGPEGTPERCRRYIGQVRRLMAA